MSDVSFVSQRHLHNLYLGRLISQLFLRCYYLFVSSFYSTRLLIPWSNCSKGKVIINYGLGASNFAGSNSNESQISFWTLYDIKTLVYQEIQKHCIFHNVYWSIKFYPLVFACIAVRIKALSQRKISIAK